MSISLCQAPHVDFASLAFNASSQTSLRTMKPSSLVTGRYVSLISYESGAMVQSVKEMEAMIASGVGTAREDGGERVSHDT